MIAYLRWSSPRFVDYARSELRNPGMGDAFGLPVGISFYGTGFSEAKLIKLASGFEAVTKARK